MTTANPLVDARSAPTGTIRLDSLTGLRWWAAFAVFAFHMKNLAPLPIDDVLRLGNSGVAFFFILSGFVLTWSARPGVSASTFWWRRFARIWPAHMVALLLAIPVFYSLDPDPAQTWVKPLSVGILLLSVVLLQGWALDPNILFSGNPAAWTLTCEAFFYALHPFINRVLGVFATRAALITSGAVLVVIFVYRFAVILWPESALGDLPTPILRVSEFVLGMTIARAMRSGWIIALKPFWCFLIGGSALLWLGFAPRWIDQSPITSTILAFTGEVTIVVFAVTIASVAARDLRGDRSLLRSRPLVVLGDVSYAFYLVHATVLYAILGVIGVQHGGWWNLAWYALVGVGSLVVAFLLHYLVEKPLERRMRRWWDKRKEPTITVATAT